MEERNWREKRCAGSGLQCRAQHYRAAASGLNLALGKRGKAVPCRCDEDGFLNCPEILSDGVVLFLGFYT